MAPETMGSELSSGIVRLSLFATSWLSGKSVRAKYVLIHRLNDNITSEVILLLSHPPFYGIQPLYTKQGKSYLDFLSFTKEIS